MTRYGNTYLMPPTRRERLRWAWQQFKRLDYKGGSIYPGIRWWRAWSMGPGIWWNDTRKSDPLEPEELAHCFGPWQVGPWQFALLRTGDGDKS